MKLFDYIDRMNLLHKLIKEKRTGTPTELAKRLRISKGRANQIIDELRTMGVPVVYSRNLKTYYYESEFEIIAKLSLIPLSEDDMVNKGAGNNGSSFSNLIFVD